LKIFQNFARASLFLLPPKRKRLKSVWNSLRRSMSSAHILPGDIEKTEITFGDPKEKDVI